MEWNEWNENEVEHSYWLVYTLGTMGSEKIILTDHINSCDG